MAKNHYNGDSPYNSHPLLLTAAGRFMPPDAVAARMASALPLQGTNVTVPSITRS